MSFPNIIYASGDGLTHRQNQSTVKNRRMGQIMLYEDGRQWRFVENGGVALISDDLIQGPARIAADYTDIVVDAAAAAGDTAVSVTPTTTTAANTYGDARSVEAYGYMLVNKAAAAAAAAGVYRVKSHVVFAASAGIIITLQDPLHVALAINDEVGFIKNPYTDVVQAVATTITNRIVGVAQNAITIDYFGWLQTKGIAAVNSAASQIVGNRLVAIVAAAGRVGVEAETSGVPQYLGEALTVPTTAGEFGGIFLCID